ncbi:MAG TPA: protein-disulfide reductase DsbD domain-containing protein [Candidatus Acidoferrum sp.]|nr:protein-disulfide reductase DsbD domain-containing protein [Candidatus Acidoferrum sp.]
MLPLVLAAQPVTSQSPSLNTGRALPQSQTASPPLLTIDQAFKLTTLMDGNRSALLYWDIQPGYYLYQQKLVITDNTNHKLRPNLPPASTLTDEFLGASKVYFDSLQIALPLKELTPTAAGIYQISVTYQGCAQDRYCFPPVTREIHFFRPK